MLQVLRAKKKIMAIVMSISYINKFDWRVCEDFINSKKIKIKNKNHCKINLELTACIARPLCILGVLVTCQWDPHWN